MRKQIPTEGKIKPKNEYFKEYHVPQSSVDMY